MKPIKTSSPKKEPNQAIRVTPPKPAHKWRQRRRQRPEPKVAPRRRPKCDQAEPKGRQMAAKGSPKGRQRVSKGPPKGLQRASKGPPKGRHCGINLVSFEPVKSQARTTALAPLWLHLPPFWLHFGVTWARLGSPFHMQIPI